MMPDIALVDVGTLALELCSTVSFSIRFGILHERITHFVYKMLRETVSCIGCNILVTALINSITAQIVKKYLYNYNLV